MNAASKSSASPLVPGRECGGCTECCVNLRIDSKQLQKPANVACRNLTPVAGCSIYGTRPSQCRSFHCGWRMLEGLDDNWRPDRLKVMIRLEQAGLVIEGLGSFRPILAKPVQDFIGTAIDNGLTIFLHIPGEDGAKLELNAALAPARTTRMREALMREIIRAMQYGNEAQKAGARQSR